jgi:hypothetical protein
MTSRRALLTDQLLNRDKAGQIAAELSLVQSTFDARAFVEKATP